jgi:hypothetical protein
MQVLGRHWSTTIWKEALAARTWLGSARFPLLAWEHLVDPSESAGSAFPPLRLALAGKIN